MENGEFKIRKAIQSDCMALSKLKRDVWNTTYQGIYPRERLENYDIEKNANIFSCILANPDIELYTVECNKELVGLMTVGKPFKLYEEYEQEVGLLYIRKDFQRMGLGRCLLGIAKQEVRRKNFDELVLSVNDRNENAISFYLAMGGEVVCREDGQLRIVFKV